MKSTLRICPKCRREIPTNAPEGLCARCVMEEAMAPSATEPAHNQKDPSPSLEEVQAAFPQYEVLELVGAGGMGAVYKARQPRLDRFVALKLLPRSLASNSTFAESFSREAKVLARLNHPNIVTVHDFGESGGFFYLVMEYVDGANLRQAMAAGRFSPETALTIVPRICEALHFAHEQGILHRDIKPENILLDARGRVKIADFGIAKLMGKQTGNATLTAEGAVVGTPRYMAPEQLERPREVDQRADIYSLGVVFYEMLTGELPVGCFAPPSKKSEVDPRVDPIVLRSLERERERRYRTVEEVKTQVEQLTTSRKTPAEPTLAPRPAAQDFILCNPRLPRFAQAITLYALLVAPFFWLLGLGLPEEKVPVEPYAALLHTFTYAVVTAGDFVAVLLLFIGGLRLRALRRSAPSILRITLWFHLLLLVVGISGLIAAALFSPEVLEEPSTFAENLYTTAATAMVAFEVWALVWLRRHRESLGELCARTAVKPGPEPAAGGGGVGSTSRLPVARGATASLVLTLLSLPFGLLFLMTALFVAMAPAYMNNWIKENATDMAAGVGVVVVPGCLGMLLGIWALQQIHAAHGQLRGMARALIAALSWPSILLLLVLNSLAAALMGGFIPGAPDFGLKFGLSSGLGLLTCVLLIYLTWRWARRGSATSAAQAWLVPCIAAVLLVFPTLLAGMISGQVHAHRSLLRARAASQSATSPTPNDAASDAAPARPAQAAGE